MSIIYVNSFQFAAPAGGYDPDAQAYITAVEVEDGQSLEIAVMDAINDFVVGCKTDGIWSAIKASCILAGARTMAGALIPLAGTAPTKNGTEGDWNYNRKTGLQGNGTDNYLNSNRASNEDPQDSFHLSFYRNDTGSNKTFCGSVNSPFDLIDNFGADGRLRVFLRSNDPVTSTSSTTNVTGFFGGNRSSNVLAELRYSSTTESSAISSSPRATHDLFVFARSLADQPNLISDARLAFYSIGESLDLARLDARVTDLINAFGVAIP